MAQWQAFETFVTSAGSKVQTIRLSTPVSIDAGVEAGVEKVLSGEEDVVFVPYTPANENLIVYPAMHAYTLPMASSDYVSRYGNPQSPEELIWHTGILKTGKGESQCG